MKIKIIILLSGILILFSVVSCLKIPDEEKEEDRKEIIIPDENFDTNTQNISVPFAVRINFSNGQTDVNNPYEGRGVTVNVDRQNVTITSTTLDMEVNYVLSGQTTNGFVKIYSEVRFGLVLNGVSILNPTGAAINIQSGKRGSVTLVDNTSNRLIDIGTFQITEDEERMNGTLYSEGQLIFGGNGSLTVYGNEGHAICVRDHMQINSGNITVNNATSDGIHCRDYFEMNGGNVIINAQSDGVESTRQYMMINEGDLKIKSGNKGLKAAENLTITGGRVEIESIDDGIRATGNLVITGGEIYCNSGKNGIVSTEGVIAVTGGLIVTSAKRNVFNCGKTFSITGGTAIGVGNATTLPATSECRQRTLVWGTSKFTADQLISIKSSDSELLTFRPPRAYSGNMALVFTSPSLQANTSYTIYKGGTVSTAGNCIHGLYSGAVSSGGTAAATFTAASMVTIVGNVMGL